MIVKLKKCIFLILCLIFSSSLFAEVDELQSQLLSNYLVPFRWESVSDKQYWTKGNKPLYDLKAEMYKITLEPGEFTLVKIPRGEHLLLQSHLDQVCAENFMLRLSQGTGLFIETPFKNTEQKGKFITEPIFESMTLARIENKKNKPIEISLFISKHNLLRELAPYREVLPLHGRSVFLRRGFEAGSQIFQSINLGCPTDLKVIGPTRLAVESHFSYPDNEGTLFQDWEIAVTLDSKPLKHLKYQSTMENVSSIFVNGEKKLVSKREVAYLDIPGGEHVLCLKSNAPLYARILSQACQDFLFKADEPVGYRHKIGDKRLERIERQGLEAAWDNRFREGAILGASLIYDAAVKRKDYRAVRHSYDNLVDYNTFYRNLVPVQLGNNNAVEYHTFILPKLLEIGVTREPYYTNERFLREYLARLGDASFVNIPNRNGKQQNAHLLYRLTPSPASSWLRVLVNIQPESLGQCFWIQLDEQKPFLFYVSDPQVLEQPDYATSAGEAGLALLKKQTELLGDASLKAPLSYNTILSDAIQAGVFEIPISSDIKTVKIWKSDQKKCPLTVALQQSASKPYQLSEYRYLSLIKGYDKFFLKKKFLTLVKNYPESLRKNDELTNHWIPLLRLLNAEYKLYVSSVAKPSALSETGNKFSENALIELNKDLSREMMSKDWLNAFETVSKVANGTNGKVQIEAKLLQSDILKNLGENYLSEHILRAQFVHETNPEFRAMVLKKLMEYYQASSDNVAKQIFYAAALKIHPTSEVFQALAETLASNGSFDLAMTVSLFLEEAKQPISATLKAAYQLGWWEVMNVFIHRLGNAEQYYWIALKDRMFKQYTDVLENFKKSNTLEPMTGRIRSDFITSHAGGELMYSIDRDLYTQTYRATREKPLKLKFTGPLRLRLETRPLHLNDNVREIDGWVEVRSKQKLWVSAINNNTASEGLMLVGNKKETPGRRVVSEIFFEAGCHELEITGGDTPIVTTVEAVTIENPVEKFSVDNQVENVEEKIARLLWLSEKDPKRYSEALAFSLSIANRYPLNAALEPLINRFSQNSTWDSVSTASNAGIRTVAMEGWQFTAPNLRVRKALLPALGIDEAVVFGNEYLILSLVNPTSDDLQLELQMADVPNLLAQNMTVNYQLDEAIAKNIQLTPDVPKQVLNIRVPQGEHALRIGIENPLVGQLLRVRVSEKNGKKIVHKLEMPYEVATQQDPIIAKVIAPAWIRIDEWRSGKTVTSYRYVASSTEVLKLFPKQDRKEALYRLYVRVPFSGKTNTFARQVPYKTDPVPEAKNADGYYQPKVSLHYRKCNPLNVHNSTWSLGGLYNERIDIDEQTLQHLIERYFELNGAYRRYAEDIRTYLNTGILGRIREKGGNTFGLSEQISYSPYLSPWSFNLDSSGYMQRPKNTKTEWSLFVRGAMTQRRDISPKLYHLPTLATFKRFLSLSTTQGGLYSGGVLDQDIFTNYKSLHRFGIEISDTFVYRPKMDTLLLLYMGAISREDYRIFTPDHTATSVGCKQLMGDYRLNAEYRFQRFYKDKKHTPFFRTQSFNRRTISLDLSKRRWFSDHLVEFKLGAQRQIEFKRYLFSLSFVYHFTHNRYYTDFSPREAESEFLDISYPQTQQWRGFGE
jgi:hypothetical protein